MAKFKDIVEVQDRPWNRAVRVIIDAPSFAGIDIQSLAQRAWRSPGNKVIEGNVTVRVEAFRR
jgi:hypothetical protein